MYINITDSKTADNKGSCGALVHYLDKENRLDQSGANEYWFNHLGYTFEAYQVRTELDANVAKLGRNDAKFFLINISPSQKELQHLKGSFGEAGLSDALKKYAVTIIDEYARNFNRPGINSAKDLLWYAKVEQHRYYTHLDKEVKDGLRKRGELKQGDQAHIQVVVSRKDLLNKVKLSPMNASRGKNLEHSKKMGQFDRVGFKQAGEMLFDKEFGFDRGLKDTMAYANVRKNGSIEQNRQVDLLIARESSFQDTADSRIREAANKIAVGMFENTTTMLESLGSTAAKFLDIMLEPSFVAAIPHMQHEPKRKKKKKKGQGQSQSIQRGM